MIKNFLKIRLIQIARELEALGWWRSVVLFVFLSFGGVIWYQRMHAYPSSLYATGALGLIVCAIHLYRKDKEFIRMTGVFPTKVYIAEYTFFSIPAFIIMLFTPYWYFPVLLLGMYTAIAFLQYNMPQKIRLGYSLPFIPRDNFEWMSGIRTNFWTITLLYLAAMGFLFYWYVSLFILWLLLAVIASFYQECEPLNVIVVGETSSKRFIRRKLTSHLKLYILFTAPIIIGYAVCHMGTAWIGAIVYLLSLINLSFFILSKYAIYEPNRKLSANNFLISAIHLSMMIPLAGPFMFPVPLIMGIRAYHKSLVQLNPFLDAYH